MNETKERERESCEVTTYPCDALRFAIITRERSRKESKAIKGEERKRVESAIGGKRGVHLRPFRKRNFL